MTCLHYSRDVHGNAKDPDLMGHVRFPQEWECDQPWHGNGN